MSKAVWIRSTPKNRDKRIHAEVSTKNILTTKRRSTARQPEERSRKRTKVVEYEPDDESDPEQAPVVVIERIRPSRRQIINSNATISEPVISNDDKEQSHRLHDTEKSVKIKSTYSNSITKANDAPPKKATLKIIKKTRTAEEEKQILDEIDRREKRRLLEQKQKEQQRIDQVTACIERLGGIVDKTKLVTRKVAYRGKWRELHPLLSMVAAVTWPEEQYYKSSHHGLDNISFISYDLEEKYWKSVSFLKEHNQNVYLFADVDSVFPICTLLNDNTFPVYILDLEANYEEGPFPIEQFLKSLQVQEGGLIEDSVSQRNLSQRAQQRSQSENEEEKSQVVVCSLYK